MPRIAEETLQQVLAATDIVDLIGRAVKLRRSGTNYMGLCPFHQEKSPSFNVNPARSTYHCFGCGVGGNAFRFVMEHDGLTFVEAVKRLADAAGIRIEEEVFDANAERAAKERQALLKVHKEIAEWFHMLLMRHKAAAPARDYLKSRSISADTAKNWQMGYAPGHGDILREWALEKKFSENILVDAGILVRGDEDSARPGETYPRFRQRLMFPIRNAEGVVIAFSGRMLDPNAKTAKYLNSPETPIFSKSKVLFGLDKSGRAIRKQNRAIVCEGQLDVISVFEAGVENVVAPLGTAFTEFHVNMLKRHAEEIVLCFDADAAGYKAAERAFTILAPSGLIVKVAPLPQGEDPDSLIRKQGTEAFRQNIAAARDFFDYLCDFAAKVRKLSDPAARSQFADHAAPLLKLVGNTTARVYATKAVAAAAGITEDDLWQRVSRSSAYSQRSIEILNFDADRIEAPPHVRGTVSMICRLVTSDWKALQWFRSQSLEEVFADFADTDLLKLVWCNTADLSNQVNLTAFLATLPPDQQQRFNRILAMPLPEGGLSDVQNLVSTLHMMWLQYSIKMLRLRAQQGNLDEVVAAELQQRIAALRKEYLDRHAAMKSASPPLESP